MVTCYISAYFTGTALRSTPAKHLPCIGEFHKPPPHRMTHRCPCLNPGVARGKIQSVIPLLRDMGQSWRAADDFVSALEWYYLIISFLSVIFFTSTASTWPGVFHPFHMQTHLDLRLIGNRSTVFEVDAGTKQLGTTGRSCDRWLICRRIMKVPTLYILIWYCV